MNINDNMLELSDVVNELVNLDFKEINEGKDKNVRKQHVLNYIENHAVILQDIYNWILNNQNHLNSVYLLPRLYWSYRSLCLHIRTSSFTNP